MWISSSDVVQLGFSERTVRHYIKIGRWQSRGTGTRGRNGKEIREVYLESLPSAAQIKYLQSSRTELPEDQKSEDKVSSESESAFLMALVRYKPEVRVAFQAEAQRLAEIVETYLSINPKRYRLESGSYDYVPAVKRLCERAVCTDSLILKIEPRRAKTPSPHTLHSWASSYPKEGLLTFLRKPPTQRASIDKRRVTISAEAIVWINSVWRKYRSARHLFRDLAKKAKKEKWIIPSESWIRRKFEGVPKIVSAAVFQGQKAYNSKYAPFLPRDYRDLDALQVLCGDHSVRDVSVMLPSGELTRPWLTIWYDLRTGLIWGWHLDLTPSSNTIGLAYANGVKNFGAQPLSRPDDSYYSCLYTDQGKDYRSKTLTGQTILYKQAARIDGGLKALCTQRKVGFMAEMDLKHILARGYNAKEKPVERVHKDISAWEQNTFENEYCGKDVVSRPDNWHKAWSRHNKLLKRINGNTEILRAESPFISLEEYREALAGFINEFNNSEHTRSVLGGSRSIPIAEYQRLYTTRYEISDQALALFLMKVATRTIGKNGIQMFQSHWYFIHEAMSEFKGETVEVRWSDGDYSRIWVVLPNGAIIEAELIAPSSFLVPNKKSLQAVKRQLAHERTVVRDFLFINQSVFRGETVEDRTARMIDPDDVQTEEQKIAVNAGPQIHNLTRFDRPKLVSAFPREVTAEDVANAKIIEGLFREEKPKSRIKEEWED